MADSKFGLPNLKIGTQTWNSKFGLPNLKIGQIPSLGTTSIIIVFIVLYYCCKKFRHMHTLFKYCFPFLPISRMLRTSCRTDLFVEVTNLTKGNTVWVHFTATGYFPTNIHLSRPITKESVRIETCSCIFK